MNTNANTNFATALRALVCDHSMTLDIVSADDLGDRFVPYKASMNALLGSLTVWARKDYLHITEHTDIDAAFAAVQTYLGQFTTEDNRIVIDTMAMRTMRDAAVKAKRCYSDGYKALTKALKRAQSALDAHVDVLFESPADYMDDTGAVDVAAYKCAVAEYDEVIGDTMRSNLAVSALYTVQRIEGDLEDLKATTKWTWKELSPVTLKEFAQIVEGYVADCILDHYNIKDVNTAKEARKAQKEYVKSAQDDMTKKYGIQ